MTGVELALPKLSTISLVMFWIAVTVWALVATGLMQFGLVRWQRSRRATSS
jgi:hypothetical protein